MSVPERCVQLPLTGLWQASLLNDTTWFAAPGCPHHRLSTTGRELAWRWLGASYGI